MGTDIVVHQEASQLSRLTAHEVRDQVNLIQEVMRETMTDGTHFGAIPGCGDKPTLLKAGAEKLCLTFRLDMQPEIEVVEMGGGHREYRVKVQVFHADSGRRMGCGVGSGSTMESKYRYRGGARLCPECNKPTIKKSKFPPKNKPNGTPPGFYCYSKIGGCGVEFAHDDQSIIGQSEERQENPDIADTYNTVLKMAKKRGMVDAALSVTAASDIFTQDIEDFEGHEVVPQTNGAPRTNPTTASTSGTKTLATAPSAGNQYPMSPIDAAWLDTYEKAVTAAVDEQSLGVAEFNARGPFGKLTGPEKEFLKDRLIAVKAAKDVKRAEWTRTSPNQAAVKQKIADDLIEAYGLDAFQAEAVALGCKGSLDGWTLEQLNAIGQRLKGIPF